RGLGIPPAASAVRAMRGALAVWLMLRSRRTTLKRVPSKWPIPSGSLGLESVLLALVWRNDRRFGRADAICLSCGAGLEALTLAEAVNPDREQAQHQQRDPEVPQHDPLLILGRASLDSPELQLGSNGYILATRRSGLYSRGRTDASVLF